jgi:DNA polymerase elongation subunit (family B)
MKKLFIDIETFPNVSYTWGMYEQNVIKIVRPWYILSFAYRWDNGKKGVVALPDFKGYKAGGDDKELTKILWELLNEADIVVAHNGDNFDLKKINTRFIAHGMTPPSPYKTIDTLKIVRNKFSFNSNHLDDLGKFLEIGEKVKHTGFDLWFACERGDKKSWSLMKKYNGQDINLLYRVYLKLLPWINIPLNTETGLVCPNCGSKHTQKRGIQVLNKNFIRQRYQCQDCGKWASSNKRTRVSNKEYLR